MRMLVVGLALLSSLFVLSSCGKEESTDNVRRGRGRDLRMRGFRRRTPINRATLATLEGSTVLPLTADFSLYPRTASPQAYHYLFDSLDLFGGAGALSISRAGTGWSVALRLSSKLKDGSTTALNNFKASNPTKRVSLMPLAHRHSGALTITPKTNRGRGLFRNAVNQSTDGQILRNTVFTLPLTAKGKNFFQRVKRNDLNLSDDLEIKYCYKVDGLQYISRRQSQRTITKQFCSVLED